MPLSAVPRDGHQHPRGTGRSSRFTLGRQRLSGPPGLRLRRDPGIRCWAAGPPPSQADVTAAAREAFLLKRCWSVRAGLWGLGSPAVRRTLFGLSPLLAEAISWWFAGAAWAWKLWLSEFPLGFWGKVVRPPLPPSHTEPPLGYLTGSSESASLRASVRMCCTQSGSPGELAQRAWRLPASLPGPACAGPGSLPGLLSSSWVIVSSHS